jgi:lipid II:glycine glycyltransferase (peptidoglycan interpeptide bridge formation enzyme)
LPGFYDRYRQWARAHDVVSEYVTFSPHEEDTTAYPGEIALRAQCVVRRLDLEPDQMLRDYKKSVPQDVKSARRAGVTVEIDLTGERASQFLAVYASTMRRRDADASYEMSLEFLDRLHRGLPGYFAYFYALLDGKIVSTELVLLSAGSSFFFRGGTLAEAFPAKPNHLLKHSIILWSREQGKRSYVLGGGNDSDDSLYRYKLSFAPRGSRPLRVGKWIFDDNRYKQLLAARLAYECAQGSEWRPRAGFFPTYRAPAELVH